MGSYWRQRSRKSKRERKQRQVRTLVCKSLHCLGCLMWQLMGENREKLKHLMVGLWDTKFYSEVFGRNMYFLALVTDKEAIYGICYKSVLNIKLDLSLYTLANEFYQSRY